MTDRAALPPSEAMDDLLASSGQPLAEDDDDWYDDDYDGWYDDDYADDDADDDADDGMMTCPRCLGDGFLSENGIDVETCGRCEGAGSVDAPAPEAAP